MNRRSGSAVTVLIPLLAAIALVSGLLLPPDSRVSLPWILLGVEVGLDETGRAFMIFSSLVWLAAGISLAGYPLAPPGGRFQAYFLISMLANFVLVVAHDVATFYAAFAVMTFAAYPLVVHDGTDSARRAGRLYLILAVIGEGLLLAGLVLAANVAGGTAVGGIGRAIAQAPDQGLITGLLLFGFGVKAGLLPVHGWLPLAHPAAPTPASAALSGSMIKAGLLGWLRFLPVGDGALDAWSMVVLGLGLAATLFGALAGLSQADPKVVLAYSSISQMGYLAIGLAAGLADPLAFPIVLTAILYFAGHHAVAKGALFLGVALAPGASGWRGWALLSGLGALGLVLAGAPLTSGSVAKTLLKDSAPTAWSAFLDGALPLAAVGTTLVLARFVWLIWRTAGTPGKSPAPLLLWFPWSGLLLISLAAAWLPIWGRSTEVSLAPYSLWAAAWPVAAAGLLVLFVVLMPGVGRISRYVAIPPGDILPSVERLGHAALAARPPLRFDRLSRFAVRAKEAVPAASWSQRVGAIERQITRWETVVVLVLLLMIAFFALLGVG